jgi:hypothetical protein
VNIVRGSHREQREVGGAASNDERMSTTDAVALGILGVLMTVLVWSRFSLIDESFWRDEAFTAVHYVDAGPRAIFFGASVPNNHVLFSVLAWITTEIGGRSEIVYRIWSVVPATAAVAIVAWWAWRRVSPFAAATTVLLTLASVVHLQLAPQARGYGLAFLAGAGMLVGAIRAGEGGRSRDVAVFAGFGAVGILTLPVFALVFLAQGAVLLAMSHVRRRALIAILLVGAVSLLAYAPLLDDLLRNTDQEFGVRLRWYGWITRPYSDLTSPMLRGLVPGRAEWPGGTVLIAGACAVLGGLALWRCLRRREHVLLASLVAPIIGTYVALVVSRLYVEPRFASYLLFHVVVLLALGVDEAWNLVRGRRLLAPLAALLAVAIIGVGIRNAVVETSDRADMPLEDFRVMGQIVEGTDVTPVLTNSRLLQGFDFYLGRGNYGVLLGQTGATFAFCDESRTFVYVAHNWQSSPDFDVDCLERRGATRIHIDQRLGSFDVWIAVAATDATR